MENFKLPNDPKKASGYIVGLLLLAAVGLVAYSYLLPWLLTIVWGTVQLGIGIAVAAVLGYILLSKKFWKRTKIILDGIGQLMFGWLVEMNKWAILNNQIESAEKDREEVMEANKRLQGQQSGLATQLSENQRLLEQSAEEVNICKRRLQKDSNDEQAALDLESSTVTFTNAKDFIDGVQPIYNDISRLVEFTDKAYRKSGNALKNAKTTLKMQKAKYDAVMAGSSAMTKALRAFSGDSDMNAAAAIALAKVQKDIVNMTGTIRTTIKATSDLMNEKDLRDAAKVNLAAKTIENLNIDATFEYVPAVDTITAATNIPKVERKNRYLNS